MDVAQIILGVVAGLAGVGFLIATFAEGSVVFLGAALLLGGGSGTLIYRGWHGEDAKFHAKHVAIVSDLRSEGLKVESGNVSAKGGLYLVRTTEADIVVGKCLIPFIAEKRSGKWGLALPASGSKDTTAITPAQVGLLAKACGG